MADYATPTRTTRPSATPSPARTATPVVIATTVPAAIPRAAPLTPSVALAPDLNSRIPDRLLWVITPNDWNREWLAAKAASDTAPVWMTILGDSYSAGSVSSDYVNRSWVGILKSTLAAKGFALYGDFWMPTASENFTQGFRGTPPFVVATESQRWLGWGYGRIPAFRGPATSAVSFTTPYACDDLDVIYFDSRPGSWMLSIDGQTARGVSCTGDGYHHRLILNGLGSRLHTLRLGDQSADNTMLIQGVATYASRTAGVGFGRVAYGGAQTSDYASTNGQPKDLVQVWQGLGTGPLRDNFPTRAPLGILAFGINDCQSATPIDQFRSTLERLTQSFRIGVPSCSVLIIAQSFPNGITSDVTTVLENAKNYPLYVDAMQKTAARLGCGFLNIDLKWDNRGAGLGFQTVGQQHPTDAGHADIAASVASII
jgi:hypothetical protein